MGVEVSSWHPTYTSGFITLKTLQLTSVTLVLQERRPVLDIPTNRPRRPSVKQWYSVLGLTLTSIESSFVLSLDPFLIQDYCNQLEDLP